MERTHPPTLRRAALALALLACTCACSREAPQHAAPAAPAAAAPPPAAQPVAAVESGPATTMAQPGVQPAGTDTDARALAGTWSGVLPCADCPGIDETLVLGDDGSFVLTDTYRERPGTASVVQGTWSLEADGRRIRLDPGSKQDADRFLEIDGAELRVLDREGKRIDGPVPPRLSRDG